MRIAGDTIRRNYLSRYEKNYSDKYSSEKKIYSGRQFDRASENPINAARALRVRKTISEVESYQDNLKTADSIYTNAEGSMSTVSTIIQSVYEKLVEGAHGTRNQNDLDIIAMDIDNYAEEMVQSFNIDIADRRVFGGMNNDTPAFKIEGATDSGKYVTYNGVALNSSNDPNSFPYNGRSYLDIGIGIDIDNNTNRIDDQSALPITFNGAEVTGCGMTSKTASISLDELMPGKSYTFDINAGGKSAVITFTADNANNRDKNIAAINEQLKIAFRESPELQDDGSFDNIENPRTLSYESLPMDGNNIDLGSLKDDTYYSMKVVMNGKTRTIDFLGSTDTNTALKNIDSVIQGEFGERAYVDASGAVKYGYGETGTITPRLGEVETTPLTADGKINFAGLEAGKNYAVNLTTPKVDDAGNPITDENGDFVYEQGKMIYFTATEALDADGNPTGAVDVDATKKQINEYIETNELFGDSASPYVTNSGLIQYDKDGANIVIDSSKTSQSELPFTEVDGYPKNLIQLVLDAGKLLRKGDQQMVARYADLIYAAQSNLSMAISDLGTHSKFIEFNEDRLADVKVNLLSKQNDIESTDLPEEITNWKVLESVYNASLQMGSKALSQTIFNYIS